MSVLKFILGLTDAETVKLDFDETTFKNVKYWADRTRKWFKLGGYIILKSSKGCYHVVFNRSVSWGQNLNVVAWVGLHSQNSGLIKWLIMQCIKQSSTLRISTKREKPSPRIVYRYGKQDQQIFNYLKMRSLTKKIIKKNHQKTMRKRCFSPFFTLFFPCIDRYRHFIITS